MQNKSRTTYAVLLTLIFCCYGAAVYSQQRISGYVTDREEKQPLYAVSVIVKGTRLGTLTDTSGYFSISAKKGAKLVFSYIGHESQEIIVENDTVLNLSLINAIAGLNKVVITGYTSQIVKQITGAVSIVKGDDLTEVPAGQVEPMLQGKVAGLTVISSGMPGGASTVRLNGVGNFGNVTPLYIIDGVEGDINDLNPEDIESLQVLKDAGSYSIYGVRGANGVIIVTTRTGKNGRTRIHYDSYYSNTQPIKNAPAVLNPQEQADALWQGYRNSGLVDQVTNNPVDPYYGSGGQAVLPDFLTAGPYFGLFKGDPRADASLYNIDYTSGPLYQIVAANLTGTDWFHALFKPAFSQNHTLTASGGNEKNKYLFSFGYLDQQGTLLNTFLKRFTIRSNTEFAVNNSIRLGENLQLSYRNNPQIINQPPPQSAPQSEIFNALLAQPILPVYDIKGGWASFDVNNLGDNPVASREIAKDNSNQFWNVLGNAFGELKLLKNFTLRTNFGGTYTNYYKYNYTYGYGHQGNGAPSNGLSETSGYMRSWTWTNTLYFSKTFNNIHSIKILAGTETVNNYSRELDASTTGFFTNDPNYRLLSNGTSPNPIVSSTASESVLYSLISRIDYGFRDKIFISATLRRDGASVFGDENRYAWFPSVSAAWRLTQENFMKPLNWITELKLRGSWGKTGYYGNTSSFNQYTLYGSSPATSFYAINGQSVSSVQGIRQTSIGDPRTGWQEDVATDIGIESVFWEGKLSVTADWYIRKSTGLLFQVTLPDVLGGASTPYENVGTVQNKGLNILLGSKGNFSADWKWNLSVTFSTYQNTIQSLPNLPYFDVGPVRNQVGYPMGSFFGLKVIGYFKDKDDVTKSPVQVAAAPGRFKFLDANKDGVIESDADRIHFGNPNPKFTSGINIGITYKGFDFSTFCYGSFGNDVYNLYTTGLNTLPPFPGSSTQSAKSKIALYDSWTPQRLNPGAPILEAMSNFSNGFGAGTNSYGVEDGTYFRNKSMILGYSLSKKLLSKYRIENLRIYLQVLNLFTITKYSGLDPELSGRSSAWGIDSGDYPSSQKQYLFGLTLGF